MGNPKIISPSAIAGQHQEQERICLNLDQVVLDDAGDDDQEQQKELQVIACLPLAVSGDNQDQEDSDQNDKTEPKQNIYIGAVQEKIFGGMCDSSARASHLDLLRPQPHRVAFKTDMCIVEAVIERLIHKPEESGRFRVEAGHQNHYGCEEWGRQDN